MRCLALVFQFVMAGLDPAIHVLVAQEESKTWITGTSPVTTKNWPPKRADVNEARLDTGGHAHHFRMILVVLSARLASCSGGSLSVSSLPSRDWPLPERPTPGGGIRSTPSRSRTRPAACWMERHARRLIAACSTTGRAFPTSITPSTKTC